jgi:hypothetical protein
MGSEMQPGVMRGQKRNLLEMKIYKSCDLSNRSQSPIGSHESSKMEFVSQKFLVELKKIYFMGSEMHPQIITAQKPEQILIFDINKDY